MRLRLTDLSALSRPLFLLLGVLVLCSVLVRYGNARVEHARADLAAQETALGNARQRVQRSDEEKQTILHSVDAYRTLERRGLVGTEQRISWLDALRAANQEAELFGVDYELAAQQPYAYAARVQAGSLKVDQSVMRLRFGLLHEEDLLRFFKALGAEQAGAFSLSECALQRLISDVSKPANQPTLRAECSLAWITIRTPPGPEKRP